MSFAVDMEPELWVLGEEERIRPVFVNLFDNAIKYGEKGSAICVTGGWTSDLKEVAQKDSQNDRQGVVWAAEQGVKADPSRQICLRISNRGFLSEKDREKIFEPFYRVSKEASREMGSAGLGLSLCRQLMEEQDGRIEAAYEEDQVVFTLWFGNGMERKTGEEAAYEV